MDLFIEHLNSIVVPDSEDRYKVAVEEAYKKVTLKILSVKDIRKKRDLANIQKVVEDELYSINSDFVEEFNKEVEDIAIWQNEAHAYDTEAMLYAANVSYSVTSINKSVVNKLLKDEDFLFSYINKDGDVIYSSMSLNDLYKSIPKNIAKKVNSKIVAGVIIGEAAETIAKDIKKEFVDMQNENIRTVVRSVIGEASARTNAEWDKKNSDIIEVWEYVAVLDLKTSSICRTLDGEIFKEFPPRGMRPKLHPNCRSVLISKPKGYEKTKRVVNLMTPEDKKKARKLKGYEKRSFLKSKIKEVQGDYTYRDAVKDYPELDNKKLIDLEEYKKKLGINVL